jgi:DNA-binding MarR family transcriptional regulator
MQATTRRATDAPGTGTPAPAEQAVVDALYEITVATRLLSRRDRIDTGAVRLLWHLSEAGPCRLSDLAELAGLDLSTVSRHVRDLGDAGYVLRRPDDSDRRALTLELAEDGREVLAEARANRAAAMTPVLASWTDADRGDLIRLLDALARDLTTESRGRADRATTDTDTEDPA